MTVNTPNPGTFLQDIGYSFTTVRDAYAHCVRLNDSLTQMAGLAGVTPQAFLQAPPYNLSATDAAALVAAMGNHVVLSIGYNGGAAPPVLNYRLNGAPFWGGN